MVGLRDAAAARNPPVGIAMRDQPATGETPPSRKAQQMAVLRAKRLSDVARFENGLAEPPDRRDYVEGRAGRFAVEPTVLRIAPASEQKTVRRTRQ